MYTITNTAAAAAAAAAATATIFVNYGGKHYTYTWKYLDVYACF